MRIHVSLMSENKNKLALYVKDFIAFFCVLLFKLNQIHHMAISQAQSCPGKLLS